MAALLEMNTAMPAPRTKGRPDLVRDEEIAGHVRTRLLACGYWSIRELECRVSDGILTLRGFVESWFQKQVAQETVRSISGVRSIVNLVAVDPDGEEGATTLPRFGGDREPSDFRWNTRSAGTLSLKSESSIRQGKEDPGPGASLIGDGGP